MRVVLQKNFCTVYSTRKYNFLKARAGKMIVDAVDFMTLMTGVLTLHGDHVLRLIGLAPNYGIDN